MKSWRCSHSSWRLESLLETEKSKIQTPFSHSYSKFTGTKKSETKKPGPLIYIRYLCTEIFEPNKIKKSLFRWSPFHIVIKTVFLWTASEISLSFVFVSFIKQETVSLTAGWNNRNVCCHESIVLASGTKESLLLFK